MGLKAAFGMQVKENTSLRRSHIDEQRNVHRGDMSWDGQMVSSNSRGDDLIYVLHFIICSLDEVSFLLEKKHDG